MTRSVSRAVGLITATVLCSLVASQAALAWDPFTDDLDIDGPTSRDPAPLVVPEGLYLVTDIYTGDLVTTVGATTTYTTETAHETPGTYARVIDVVASGDDSVFDGSSFNARTRLADGRAVAGTYYEDFVLTPTGFVSVNIVFFQDDSETRAAAAANVGAGRSHSASSIPPIAAEPIAPSVPPAALIVSVVADAPAPLPEREPVDEPGLPPAPRHATAGVALAPTGPTLVAIEVLRGRTVHLWPRAFVDGAPVTVRTWRLAAGTAEAISRRDGGGGDPCDVQWLTLPPAGTTLTLRFEITSDSVPGYVLTAALRVAVRSPALGE
jgi:hypothetical protein